MITQQMLQENDYKVTFYKVSDGNVRTMYCSLNPAWFPPRKGTSTASRDPDIIVCIDLSIGEWRSFYKSSVISYELIENQVLDTGETL